MIYGRSYGWSLSIGIDLCGQVCLFCESLHSLVQCCHGRLGTAGDGLSPDLIKFSKRHRDSTAQIDDVDWQTPALNEGTGFRCSHLSDGTLFTSATTSPCPNCNVHRLKQFVIDTETELHQLLSTLDKQTIPSGEY